MLNDIEIFKKMVSNLLSELELTPNSPILEWELDFRENFLEIFVQLKSGYTLLISTGNDCIETSRTRRDELN